MSTRSIVSSSRLRSAEMATRSGITRLPLLPLLVFAFASFLAAAGLETLADMRERHHHDAAARRAPSPLPFGQPLAALHGVAGGGVRAVVRVDSAAGRQICTLFSETRDEPAVVWLALSSELPGCIPSAVVRSGEPDLRDELLRARWVLVGADGAARHSARDLPTGRELRETLRLFSPVEVP